MREKLQNVVKIACIGECMVELSGIGHSTIGFAGDTMNTAVYLSRLLDPAGFEVSYLTRLGTDNFSTRAIEFLSSEGIATGHIGRDSDRNIGLYAIDLDDTGERSFTYWRGQSAARGMFGNGLPALSDLSAFDVIFLSAITLAILPPDARTDLIVACGVARDQGRVVAFDSNYRPGLWGSAQDARDTMDQMWGNCSIAMPSLDDELTLYPELTLKQILKRIAAFGVDEVALKSGEIGPTLWPEQASGHFSAAVKVVDTTGAGDSFDAGYLAARLLGETQVNAATMGHNLALKVIAEPGAIISTGSR